jgi:hypothetical protein
MAYETFYDSKSKRIEIRKDKGHWYTIHQVALYNLAIEYERRLKSEGYFGPHDSTSDIMRDEWFIFKMAVEESQVVEFEEVAECFNDFAYNLYIP